VRKQSSNLTKMRNFLIFCATVAVVAAAPQFSLTGSGFGLGGGYLGMSSLLGGHADTAALDAATVAAFRNALISQLSSATQGSAADRQAVIAALQSGQLNSLLANIINGGIGAQAGSGAGGANQGGSNGTSAGAGQTASGVASTLLDLARRLESSTMASMRALATKFRQLASALGGAVSGAAGSAGSSTGAAGGSGSSGGSTAGGAEAGTGGAAGGSASAGGAAGGSASAGGGAGGSVGIGGGGLSIGASV